MSNLVINLSYNKKNLFVGINPIKMLFQYFNINQTINETSC